MWLRSWIFNLIFINLSSHKSWVWWCTAPWALPRGHPPPPFLVCFVSRKSIYNKHESFSSLIHSSCHPKLQCAWESPGDLDNTVSWAYSQSFQFCRSGAGLEMFLSSTFPGVADAAGAGTTLGNHALIKHPVWRQLCFSGISRSWRLTQTQIPEVLVLNTGCPLEVPGEFLKVPITSPQPRPVKLESLWWWRRHEYFLKLPRRLQSRLKTTALMGLPQISLSIKW